MKRAQVLDVGLQQQLAPHMEPMKPRPSVYYPDFIAANQSDRADNVISGNNKWEHLEHLRADIRDFKTAKQLDTVSSFCQLNNCYWLLTLATSKWYASVGNESTPIQLEQCRFPGLAVSSAKMLIYFFKKKHVEAILSNSTRKLLCFEITKMLIAF